MRKPILLPAILAACLIAGSVPARAESTYCRMNSEIPSVFNYGWRGLLLGSVAGLAAGYVRYAGESNNTEILNSIAYGALAGAGGGLIAGFADTSYNSHTGDIIIHDMYRGGGFGLGIGLVWGGINAITKSDSREVGLGASWGYLGGLLLGVGVAFVENANGISAPSAAASPIAPSFALYFDRHRRPVPGIRFAYRY
jgi:hypothetical protein